MRFAIYMTASTVHFMSARLTMHLTDQFDWLSFTAACSMIFVGIGFGGIALFGSKEGSPTIPDEQRIRQDERTAIAAYIGMSPAEVTDRQYHMEAIRTGRYRDDPLMQRGM